ncbi:tRNA uridine-5-carboxymethylaminomethyl(34) synthesis GTPase MnmE [Denitratimonas sp. CY0512]|uniref:tRNA uridine-5-carboxymethylaminomethyl(34) synthesis GTPase MnmE n=1 Tax=Denitratimonas sp. CY0512 TaxID=3131940 RepID=UPI0030B2830A
MQHNDTIAAIATPPAAGGIGVIRVSGPQAGVIAAHCLGKAPTPRHAHYAQLRDAQGELIDSGLLLWFPGPASFTGEDVLELQMHGSRPLLHALLRELYRLGARPARPGEFSERAFLNGKIDLAQAEAIADLIGAGSEAAARAAQRSLQGEFSRMVGQLVEDTIGLRVSVESAIDFSDEDIQMLSPAALLERLEALRTQLEQVLDAARRGQRLRDGLHVVILGPPNAGKSSLLNVLAADDRAIVTAQAGTTRDLLRETIEIDGIELTLVDTAGLREAEDLIEREGIRRAHEESARADLILYVAPAVPEPGATPDPPPRHKGVELIRVHSKIDLTGEPARREQLTDGEHLWLSASSGAGLDLLRQSLRAHAGLEHGDGGFSARARHVEALLRTSTHLDDAEQNLQHGAELELAAEDLRQAQIALGEITGEFSTEDLLGRIFANFCIGK